MGRSLCRPNRVRIALVQKQPMVVRWSRYSKQQEDSTRKLSLHVSIEWAAVSLCVCSLSSLSFYGLHRSGGMLMSLQGSCGLLEFTAVVVPPSATQDHGVERHFEKWALRHNTVVGSVVAFPRSIGLNTYFRFSTHNQLFYHLKYCPAALSGAL